MAANIIDMLNSIYGQPNSTLDDAIADISRQAQKAQELANAAQGQLRGSIVEPTPQVPPAAQALLAGTGLAAESLTGRKGAFGYGQGLINEQNQNLLERRRQSIAELEQAYREAAGRAEKMQDFEASLKFKVKADRELGRLNDLGKAALQGQEQEFRGGLQEKELASRERMATAENASRERVAGAELAGRLGVARMEFSARMESAKTLPPELGAQVAPMLERMKQLSQSVGSIMSDVKMKEGDRKKRLNAVNEEYAQDEQAYQDALQNYFQTQPAGKTGEAAQTPLGAIYARARAAGAVTFEDFRKMAYANTQSAFLRGYNIKSVLEGAKVDAPGAGFPTAAAVNKASRRYRQLTTGALRFSSISQNADEIDQLAAQLNRWGFNVPDSAALRAKPSYEIPETVVRPPSK